MKIEWLENGYTNHGCNILPSASKRVGMVNYYAEVKNHGFNSANRHDGLYDYKDKAEALVKSECSGVVIRLHIPDLVFQCDHTDEFIASCGVPIPLTDDEIQKAADSNTFNLETIRPGSNDSEAHHDSETLLSMLHKVALAVVPKALSEDNKIGYE